jgi:hypothetical protein
VQHLLKLLKKCYAGNAANQSGYSYAVHISETTLTSRYRDAFRTVISLLEDHALFIALIAAFGVIAISTSIFFPSSYKLSFSLYNSRMLLSAMLFVGLFLMWRVVMMMIYDKPDHPTRYLIQDLRTHYFTCERATLLVILLLVFPVFSSSFTYLKSMIPVLNPFSWDPVLCELDRLIHFGVDPWRLLQPLIGYPTITKIINVLYNLWIFIWFFYLFYLYFSTGKRKVRMQFLVSFILCWGIIGVLFATLLSSAGPCFFERLYPGNSYYSDLMDYLVATNKTHDIWAVHTQDLLWQQYEKADIGIGSGISAMPSMHVSITFLITLTHYRINRKVAHLILLYSLLILIGSVHLGWHYAIDGYISIVITYAIWYASGKLIQCKS